MVRSSVPALNFKVLAHCPVSRARIAQMELPHFVAETPMFMPVGTKGTIKGLTTDQVLSADCHVILGNTYHLSLKPGQDLIKEMQGLHSWMSWRRALLTDSGGFQMVSLLNLSSVNEYGVTFLSPYHDDLRILLTPEKSIELQNAIGADIIMQLDDVVNPLSSRERIEEAMWRSIRWLDRCIEAHQNPSQQNLFPIIQGGLYPDLRKKCIEEMVKRDAPGYAIGGLSGGEDKAHFWRIISLCTSLLPENKPRYCMGIGYALDLVVCVSLGVDMFDCVFPTRTARFGNALVPSGSLSLRNRRYRNDLAPIDSECHCHTCKNYSRSYLHMIATRETAGCHLISIHNISYQMNLMRNIRDSIVTGQFPSFVLKFCKDMYGDSTPLWAKEALASVGIHV